MAKKKKKNAKKLVLGVLVAYVAIMALGYMGVSYYFSSHFLKGTTTMAAKTFALNLNTVIVRDVDTMYWYSSGLYCRTQISE